MHRQADEALTHKRRLARVETHTHSRLAARRPGMGRERTLPLDGGHDGIEGAPKGDEECIALDLYDLPPDSSTARRSILR